MADPHTTFKIKAQIEGLEKVQGLKNAVRGLANSAKPAAAEITQLHNAAKQLATANNSSTNQIRASISALETLKASVSTTSVTYRQLAKDIDQARARLAALNATAKTGGGFMAGAKAAAPAALTAATASFLPGSAQFGMAAGYATTKTTAGAIGGLGIGLGLAGAVGIGNQIKESAQYAAQISRLEIALKAVTKTGRNYAKSQEVIQRASKELNVPIDVATKQFTQLSASVLGSNGTIEDAETVFRGVSEAIKATGGNAEDIQSGIRAMSQIFGKGKVSAEELQGQLGERLAGAVVKFAKANGSTLEQLQKDLRDGTVGLDKIMKFAEQLRVEHKQGALDMAASQEEAGERMKVALKDLQNSFGQFFKPVGAGFQNIITWIARMTEKLIGAANEIKLKRLEDQLADLKIELETGFDMGGPSTGILGAIPKQSDKSKTALEGLIKTVEDQINAIKGVGDETDDLTKKTEKLGSVSKQVWEGMKDGAKAYGESIKSLSEEIAAATENIFKKMEDQLVQFITKGKLNFQEFASSIIEEMTRVFVRTQIMKPFTSWFQGLNFFGNAKGNVYAQNGIVPFAKGGVVDKPTLFPFAKGAGLMGEAGPEAIMPLKRSQDGRLGVEAAMGRYSASGGTTTVNYTGPVMSFNGDDYVPRSSVEDIINAAANRGASIGEARTLSSLRNSRSRRSNLGL